MKPGSLVSGLTSEATTLWDGSPSDTTYGGEGARYCSGELEAGEVGIVLHCEGEGDLAVVKVLGPGGRMGWNWVDFFIHVVP